MKKLIALCLAVMAMASAFAAEERDYPPDVAGSFAYVDLGLGPAPAPLPIFGLGGRIQCNHVGLDINARVSTVVGVTQVKLNLIYLHYFNPDPEKQFYFGIGPGVGGLFGSWLKRGEYTLSPELLFGKEYRSDTGGKRFFQVQISWPTYSASERRIRNQDFTHGDLLWYPLVAFHYGWGF